MEANEISHLATLLRDNGDKILNFNYKLSLSASLLNNLNSSFNLVVEQRDSLSSSFHVINNSNTRIEVFRDLQFLHDFIQRTASLKLTTSSVGQLFTENVDISKFKNLKMLELQKVNVSLIFGLQLLRNQLHYLICNHSINAVSDILEKCGADNCQGFIWSELKEIVFSHNGLVVIDNSFEFTPWVHTVDLSYNQIKDPSPLNCLHNLKFLNLGYNCLETAPFFTGQLCSRLQVLVLCNNYIEDIRDLAVLINLYELDLSYNCLLEHNKLSPLGHLAALQWLSLEGNPLSYHPHHRPYTVRYLHVNTATVKFVLQRALLNSYEKRLVGTLRPMYGHLEKTCVSSHCSAASECTLVPVDRPRRIRQATITDGISSSDIQASVTSTTSLLTSGEHLETKRQIEQLRQQFGETWLHSESGSLVQDALGLDKSTVAVPSTVYESDFLLHANNVDAKSVTEKSEVTSEQSANVTFTTAPGSETSENSVYAGEQIGSPESLSEGDEDLEEGEENLYLATVKDERDQVFVVVTSTHLWERECTSSKEKARWPLESLLSCQLIGTDNTCVELEFDTLKRDRRKRQYELDTKEAVRLVNTLRMILANKPELHTNLIVYHCMKCSTQFTEEKEKPERDDGTLQCPTCNSTLVIEHDD